MGEQRLNEWKTTRIPEREGFSIQGENFRTGSLLITRKSVKGVIAHSLNLAVRDSLLGIEQGAVNYRYIGWKECGVDENGHRKHPEAAFFLYYEVEIGGQTYYANIKAHRHYKSEVLYCIREHCNIAELNHSAPPNVDDW